MMSKIDDIFQEECWEKSPCWNDRLDIMDCSYVIFKNQVQKDFVPSGMKRLIKYYSLILPRVLRERTYDFVSCIVTYISLSIDITIFHLPHFFCYFYYLFALPLSRPTCSLCAISRD